MNSISKKEYHFYAFFHFSSNSRKGIDKSEKENLVHLIEDTLKLKTINARNLLKSFQPIHRLIIIRNIFQLIKTLKLKKWNIDN